jgi:hypothetical protein
MTEQLSFLGWMRPAGHDLATTATVDGRLSAGVSLTVSDVDDPADARTRALAYDLIGPGDVTGLNAGAVIRTYPTAGSRAAEVDKAVYAELAAPDLPWRYTLDRPRAKALRPWIILIVGTADEIEVTGERVRIQPSALDAHALADSARLAHVEADASGHLLARLISPRALLADRAHVAVIVPAFDAHGAPSWETPATGPVELLSYYSWTFQTKAGGDFATLARRLHIEQLGSSLGTADVAYGPIPTAAALAVRGALVGKATAAQAPVANDVSADLRTLTRAGGDATHPVIGLPDLGAAWSSDGPAVAPGWRDALSADYRARAVAGLGEHAGIVHQEMLAEQAGRIAGAYEEVADRLRRLAAGLLTSRSMWRRRIPNDPVRRLAVLGPALREVLTATGPVNAAMEHPQRALERSLFSAAAHRVLRPRPAGAPVRPFADVGDTLPTAAAAPLAPTRSMPGTLHTDVFAAALRRQALDDLTGRATPDTSRLREATVRLADGLDRRDLDPETSAFVGTRISRVVDEMRLRRPVPIVPLLDLLDGGRRLDPERARTLATALDAAPDADDLAAVATRVRRRPPLPVTTSFDLAAATVKIDPAFDPTAARPSIADRALAGLSDAGVVVDVAPAGPIELAPDLDLPTWRFVRDDEPEWLLPGMSGVKDDTVVGLTTNPAFVETFLVGLNAQIVSELRFRNYPLIPGWTPVRTFWDRADPGTGDTDDDIVGIHAWSARSPFGDVTHQAPSASSADLVILFNTRLFLEYPGTVVSLVPAARAANGEPDWVDPPFFEERIWPSFLGRIAPDRTFFGFDLDPALGERNWVVLEETVSGRRFLNASGKTSTARNGADLAAETLSTPRRVMIRGDILLKGLGE